jgi:hypothetical protein
VSTSAPKNLGDILMNQISSTRASNYKKKKNKNKTKLDETQFI